MPTPEERSPERLNGSTRENITIVEAATLSADRFDALRHSALAQLLDYHEGRESAEPIAPVSQEVSQEAAAPERTVESIVADTFACSF